MRNTSSERLAGLFLSAALAVTWTPEASAVRSYGTNVDNFCVAQGTAAPIQGDCSACHTSNTSTRVEPEWTWYLNGQVSSNGWINFCGPSVPNGPPDGTIASPAADVGIGEGAAVRFAGSATDPDGDPVSYSWAFPGGTPSSSTLQSPGDVTYAAAGTYTATLVVSDNQGNSDTNPPTRVITVAPSSTPNTPPNGTITSPAAGLTVTAGDTVTFSGAGSDPDGDALRFSWSFGGAAADATTQSPGPVQLNAVGTFLVTFTVTDSRGAADPTPATRTLTVQPRLSDGACSDADGDGFSPEGGICGPIDCDDTDGAVNPAAAESCGDGRDNDCDGHADGADSECDGSDCVGALLDDQNRPPSLALQLSREADRDPYSALDGSVVSGSLYVFVPAVAGITQVRYYLDGALRQTENYAPWDFAGGNEAAANPFDSRTITDGTHDVLAEIDLDTGQTVAAQAGFVVNNGVTPSIDIARASWSAYERELEVEGAWPAAGVLVTVSNARTGALLGTTSTGYDDGVLGYEFERSGLAVVPCRVRVEIAGRFGERNVSNAPANCDGADPTPVNRQPVAQADSAATDEDQPVSIPVLANDSDPDGDTLAIASLGSAANGSVQLAAGGVLYTPAPNWSGTDGFGYTVSDGRGGTATATVTVTVRPVNDPPVARADSATTAYATAVLIPVLDNDSDPDGDPLTVASVGSATNGTVQLAAGGVLYTPAPNWSGNDGFVYTLSDGRGGSATATVTVAVQAPPEPPEPPNPSISVRIEEASWSRRRERLELEGNHDAPAGATLSVSNATTGTLLTTTTIGQGEWELNVRDPSVVPCRVRVEIVAGERSGSAESRVRSAPRNCR